MARITQILSKICSARCRYHNFGEIGEWPKVVIRFGWKESVLLPGSTLKYFPLTPRSPGYRFLRRTVRLPWLQMSPVSSFYFFFILCLEDLVSG